VTDDDRVADEIFGCSLDCFFEPISKFNAVLGTRGPSSTSGVPALTQWASCAAGDDTDGRLGRIRCRGSGPTWTAYATVATLGARDG
jgi:hypothetical protein